MLQNKERLKEKMPVARWLAQRAVSANTARRVGQRSMGCDIKACGSPCFDVKSFRRCGQSDSSFPPVTELHCRARRGILLQEEIRFSGERGARSCNECHQIGPSPCFTCVRAWKRTCLIVLKALLCCEKENNCAHFVMQINEKCIFFCTFAADNCVPDACAYRRE